MVFSCVRRRRRLTFSWLREYLTTDKRGNSGDGKTINVIFTLSGNYYFIHNTILYYYYYYDTFWMKHYADLKIHHLSHDVIRELLSDRTQLHLYAAGKKRKKPSRLDDTWAMNLKTPSADCMGWHQVRSDYFYKYFYFS